MVSYQKNEILKPRARYMKEKQSCAIYEEGTHKSA